MSDTNWHSFVFELKMHLGEIAVSRFLLTVQRREFSLAEIRDTVTEPPLPKISASTAGYLLSNIPQPCTQHMISKRGAWLYYCLKSYQRCYIDMCEDFETYSKKFSSKTRSGIKRKIKKFALASAGLDVRRYSTPSEIETFFELARPVSAASYQERLLDCGLPNDPEFIRDAISAAERDGIRAFLLFANGAPVSYLYCPIQNSVLQYAYLGYDPELAKLSPGTVLQWIAIEQLFAEHRYDAFDFTEGDSPHKRMFSTHQVPCSQQLILKPTVKNFAVVTLHRVFQGSSDAVARVLDRLELKHRIKRWLRRTA